MHINHRGGLMTVGTAGLERCLGHLFEFEGHGIYEPSLGRVEVTAEEAATHNRLLDEALLRGLDDRCEVGQGGTLYYSEAKGVHTWTGMHVSGATATGRSITFHRKGKTFRGRLREGEGCFAFKRIE